MVTLHAADSLPTICHVMTTDLSALQRTPLFSILQKPQDAYLKGVPLLRHQPLHEPSSSLTAEAQHALDSVYCHLLHANYPPLIAPGRSLSTTEEQAALQILPTPPPSSTHYAHVAARTSGTTGTEQKNDRTENMSSVSLEITKITIHGNHTANSNSLWLFNGICLKRRGGKTQILREYHWTSA